MSPLEIRDARPNEHDELARLTLAAYAQYAQRMTPTAWAGLSDAVQAGLRAAHGVERIVAVQGGRIVGSVMLFAATTQSYGDLAGQFPWPELRLLAVADEARGQGIGRALVAECVARARQQGASALGLHTSRSMAEAIALYSALGFVRSPAHDFQPAGAELVEGYLLPLPAAARPS